METIAAAGSTVHLSRVDGDVSIKPFRDGVERAIFELSLQDCDGVRYVNEELGEWLEFAPAKCLGSRYDGFSPPPFRVAVSVKPGIRLRMFSHDSA